ncbi:RluA family pseudouridine synthase [Roseateles sp. BYS180W]|uniref:RluA family pseudouridine synthase n=1 Tax=Roseateles rivi TaxID=3299028 RepID=A0ABW7FZJ9_9BURK
MPALPSPPHQPLQLVHADERLLVLNKPPGLLAVPGRGADKQDCLWHRVLAQYPDALVVHRLDQATSGLLLFARGAQAQRELSACFAQRRVRKHYVAELSGRFAHPGATGSVDLPLRADWPNRPRQMVDVDAGKPALTHWEVLSQSCDRTRVKLEPHTGRSHQLRVHMLSLGHPIVGDALYAPPSASSASPRLLLHACALELLDTQQRWQCPADF